MKKLFVIFSFSCLSLISCGGGNTNPEKEARAENAEETLPENPDYEKGLELVAQSDCFTCHKVSEPFTGPAYQAVADRYDNNPAVIDTLADKIIKGGAGRWGQVPMIAHPQVSKENAVTMVKYIMALKKK
jgi:cytochrome c